MILFENCPRFRRVLFLLAGTLILVGMRQPAQAAIITHNVDVTLNASNIESFNLDVDRNGSTDFTFTAALALDPVLSVGFDVVDFPFGSHNGIVIDAPTGDGFPTASLLHGGDVVSAANTFSTPSIDQGNLFFFTTFDPPTGHFDGQTGFLGLRFDSAAGTLYGFAEVTVNDLNSANNPLGVTIGAVGFNDVAGQPAQIPVPEPSSLALFLIGWLGVWALSYFELQTREVSPSCNLSAFPKSW